MDVLGFLLPLILISREQILFVSTTAKMTYRSSARRRGRRRRKEPYFSSNLCVLCGSNKMPWLSTVRSGEIEAKLIVRG